MIRDRSDAFGWDYLLLDEAQDWPEDERDLLWALYPPRQFVIADGMDQLVRSEQPCDWRAGLGRADVRVVPLGRCLRMKSALARFANELAAEIGLAGWQVEENTDAPGGRVIVVDGDYFAGRELHDRLMLANEEDGNQPVDTLVCVPPVLVHRVDGVAHSVAAHRLEAWGHSVWDGVSTDVRDSYATSTRQMRIVQYDSCRGLEGWVVVHLGLDEFYRYKVSVLATAVRWAGRILGRSGICPPFRCPVADDPADQGSRYAGCRDRARAVPPARGAGARRCALS